MAFRWFYKIIASRAERRTESQRQERERIQKERDEMAALKLQLITQVNQQNADINQQNADILKLESELQSAKADVNAEKMRQLMQMNGISPEKTLRAREQAFERNESIGRSYCTLRCSGKCKGYHY